MKAWVAIACLALLLPEANAQSAKRATTKASSAETKKEEGTSASSKEKLPAKAKTEATKKTSEASKPPSTSTLTKAKAAPTDKAAGTATGAAKSKETPGTKVSGKNGEGTAKSADAETKTGASKAESPKKSAPSKLDKPPQDNAGEEPTRKRRVTGPNITLDPEDLADFEKNPERVKRLIVLGLELTRQGLTYRYGSSDPSTGGMDCSGTIYYLLKAAGIKEPPRDSSGIYLWAQKEGTLHRVSPASLEDSAMSELRPGDLLFWEGTYEVQRDPPISHTMIYLGREKKTGIHVMVGASDGRTYGAMSRNGVSVFDFKLPRADSAAKFVAYARVPGFR